MNFSTWSIRHPIPPIAIFLALVAVGIVSFLRLPITLFPNVDIPIVNVTVTQAGSAPSEIMTQIGQPVENAITGVNGVKHITTIANDSTSTTTVEFNLEIDPQRALNDVKDAVTRIRTDLPGAIEEPIVQRVDVSGLPIMTYAVTDPTLSVEELSYFVDDSVQRELQGLASVGEVNRIGGIDEQINVDLDPDRLASLGVTAAAVSQQLSATNINLGGGRGTLGSQEFSIRAIGSALSVGDLAALPIAIPGGRSVRLDALGTVRSGGAEIRSFATYDGEPVVAFQIVRASGGSDTQAAENVRNAVQRLQTAYPNATFTLIDDLSAYTSGNYEQTMDTLYEGAALAVIVVFLFLWDWRATLIAAVAMPLSVIPTFLVMSVLGFSLNQISLLALTLVTGILVDDAIVEIENIERHMAMGRDPYHASMEAAEEIGLTVIAISSTIVAVFTPVSFMSGIAGQYFKQFGLTVAIAVLFSLAVARLITPMMAAYMLRNRPHHGAVKDGLLMRGYLRMLAWTLRNRVITLVLGLSFFAGSIYSATLLETTFIPVIDNGRSILSVELPPGALISDNEDKMREIEERMHGIPEIAHVLVNGGKAVGGGTTDPTRATVSIFYKPREDRTRTKAQLETALEDELAAIPDIRTYFADDNGQRAVSISVLGDSRQKAEAFSNDLIAEINKLGKVKNVTSGAALQRPELQITPRADVAAELGVTANSLAQTIRVSTIGDVDANLAKFNKETRQVPIVVRFEERARNDLSLLRNQKVATSTGGSVPLGVVADVRLGQGPSQLERYDRRDRVTVGADLPAGAPLGTIVETIQTLPVVKSAPPGVSIQNTGDAEVMGEVFTGFALAIAAGVLMVYAVLVLLFGSFITPITILLSLPLSIGGAILGLYLADDAISLPVVIGFLMLMGIVTKNAIMLVEFAVAQEAAGMKRSDAIIDAAHKRARPIIMTTIAMTAGMVPSALGVGEGGEFRSPMAVAVIGGLVVSTLLSLVFIPTLHSLIEGAKTRIRRLLTFAFNSPVAAPDGHAPAPAPRGTPAE
ncbi:efflux RND transporter permease subunit [Mangrovicella endophytica]|uniref:efflux RND transporter permease subunit n=1 Tax=Mangrovicella endophytica TaxID=2066697 RepID=UPI000C9E2B54|nr:efflux RND transporter permease subunit [Mangrovicella endophytica]